MKKIILKISFLLVLVAIISCNNDYLERYPLDKISNQTFWNSETDLESFNNSIYMLASNDANYWFMMGYNNGAFAGAFNALPYLDEMTDNMAPKHSRHSGFARIRSGKQPVPTEPVSGGWYWDLLRSCNVFLQNYQKAEIPGSIKNQYAGEVKLFRAWFYHDKVKRFGDVPWVAQPLNIDDPILFGERNSREMIMDSVLADINFACEYLPESWNSEAPGRMNKWCALAVKSRICLYEGTFRKYHQKPNAEMWLEEAVDAARQVIDGGQFSLYNTGDTENDYRYSFHQADLSGNPEVIYWRKYITGIVALDFQRYFSEYHGGATKDLVEDYLCTDGNPISLSPLYQGDDQIEDIFVNRDPRLRQTILHPDDKTKLRYNKGDVLSYPRLEGMDGGLQSTTGYHVVKFYDADQHMRGFERDETAAITLRYAEVLLNYAEALAELGEITQQDINISVNALRDRVGMPHLDMNNIAVDPKYAASGISPLLVEIRRERRLELFAEGFRYDDLIRWKQGKKLEQPDLGMRWEETQKTRFPKASVQGITDPSTGKTYINVYSGTDFATPVFDENKHYLWPIPTSVLSQNPNLGQNPGW